MSDRRMNPHEWMGLGPNRGDTGAFAVMLDRPNGDRLTVVRHLPRENSQYPPDIRWSLPGGKVESMEDYKDAACREAREETAMVFHPLFCLGSFRRMLSLGVMHIYVGYAGKEGAVGEPDAKEVDLVETVTFEEALALGLFPAQRTIIERYLYERESNFRNTPVFSYMIPPPPPPPAE